MVFPDSSAVKNLPVMQRRRKCLGQEDPLEKEMETHPSILVLKNPMDRGAWQSYSPKCHKESDLTEQACLHSTIAPRLHNSQVTLHLKQSP